MLAASHVPSGCATRDAASLIHPHRPGRRFRECSVDLSTYKPVQQRKGPQDEALALAVAISGGGHRATNFGTGVLLALERITKEGSPRHNALREVDYFSTVSGGGLTAAAYLGSLRDHLAFGGAADEYSFARAVLDPAASGGVERQRTDPKLKSHLERGYVNDVINRLFTVAALGTRDRGDLLEQAFDDHILGYQWRRRKLASRRAAGRAPASLTLGDIFVPRGDAGAAVRLPYWVAKRSPIPLHRDWSLDATVFENGALFPFTPDHLKLYQVHAYRHRCRRRSHDPAGETYDSFLAAVPLSVALTAEVSNPVTSGLEPRSAAASPSRCPPRRCTAGWTSGTRTCTCWTGAWPTTWAC